MPGSIDMAKYRERIPYKLCKNQVLNVFMAFAGFKGTKPTVAQFGGKNLVSRSQTLFAYTESNSAPARK